MTQEGHRGIEAGYEISGSRPWPQPFGICVPWISAKLQIAFTNTASACPGAIHLSARRPKRIC